MPASIIIQALKWANRPHERRLNEIINITRAYVEYAKKIIEMNAQQFCGEYARESDSGRITFTTATVNKFIKVYTCFNPEDFSKEQIKRIRSLMIDLYDESFKFQHHKEREIEKIELSDFILLA